ncbi:MAG: ABC transporter substrate-binding protein [Candidatus Dormibacteraeota bacterium]|nr:ABC transporter substrate-binding protein [Candidatus Dormibacteraeota bacterium]
MTRVSALGLGAVLLVAACGSTPAPSTGSSTAGSGTLSVGNVEFLSSQAQPIDEAQGMRNLITGGVKGTVDFNVSITGSQIVSKILAEHQAGKLDVDLIGDIHGNSVALQNAGALQDLTPLLQRLQKDRKFDSQLVTYGKLGTSKQYYIPWLQATYMMAVNKKALPYLPKGADVNNLTYDQLITWGQNMEKATGEKKIGLPAAGGVRGGLLNRFIQAYLLPSYTGGTVAGFKSSEAVQAWQEMKRLWAVSNPQSTTYGFMQEPLQSGEVWVAWDHQARLIDAFKNLPGQVVAAPSPSGPKGLGFASVVAGLAIPVGAPNQKGAEAMIDFLTRPDTQRKTSGVTGFFPVLSDANVSAGSAPAQIVTEAGAAAKQAANHKAIAVLLPVGLGAKDAEFNKAFVDTFTRIILNNENIQSVLNDEAGKAQALLDTAKAPCWPPDPPSTGTCQIK